MADIEKVIKGLEICKNHDGSNCLECPYFVDGCVDDLCADALELIRSAKLVHTAHAVYTVYEPTGGTND